MILCKYYQKGGLKNSEISAIPTNATR